MVGSRVRVPVVLLLSLWVWVAAAIRPLKDGPKIDSEGREYKSAAVRIEEDLDLLGEGSGVQVQCSEVSMVVRVKADLYGNRRLLSPDEVFLGGVVHSGNTWCRAADDEDDGFIIQAGLQDCGMKLSVTKDSVIYSNELIISPAAGLYGITRKTPAVVPVSCHYKREHFVSSGTETLPLRLSASVADPAGNWFSLKLLTDDWSSESSSSVFYLGDVLHLEASYSGPDPGSRQTFIDYCVASLTPDVASVPRYYFVTNKGCFTDSEETSNSFFLPRTRPDALQLQLEVFLFHQDPRNTIFITCQMKAASEMWHSSHLNKACSYKESIWESIDGNDDVCQCCEGTCRESFPRDPTVCGTVTIGPLRILPSK